MTVVSIARNNPTLTYTSTCRWVPTAIYSYSTPTPSSFSPSFESRRPGAWLILFQPFILILYSSCVGLEMRSTLLGYYPFFAGCIMANTLEMCNKFWECPFGIQLSNHESIYNKTLYCYCSQHSVFKLTRFND